MAARWIAHGFGKRCLDLTVAVAVSVVLLPLAALVGVVVRLRLGAPVIFRQQRAGRQARRISVPKFRSMTNAVDRDGALLPDDQRLTQLGLKLRALSLDELPQLWTVIKGDMSLVGPRPLPCAYVERYNNTQRRRLEAKPGITGFAQVNGRNATSWADRLAQDVWYVDHASLRLDLRILAATVKTAFRREGVSAEGHATMPEFMGEQ